MSIPTCFEPQLGTYEITRDKRCLPQLIEIIDMRLASECDDVVMPKSPKARAAVAHWLRIKFHIVGSPSTYVWTVAPEDLRFIGSGVTEVAS